MREILFRGFHPCDGPETIVVDGEKVKGIVATMIFKKMDWMERRAANWN